MALLSKYLLIMDLRFDAMLYSNLGNENSDAGHIKCSRGLHLAHWPQTPHSSRNALPPVNLVKPRMLSRFSK